MEVKVDRQVCIGCTLCTQLCPEIFKMEQDKSIAYQSTVPTGKYECARGAAEQCPVQAIALSSCA